LNKILRYHNIENLKLGGTKTMSGKDDSSSNQGKKQKKDKSSSNKSIKKNR
jgi:hypothetical protein